MNGDIAGLVLAGGRARRLGGADKAGLMIGGRSLVDRTLDALGDADPVVVVGSRRPVSRDVVWTLEDPPGSGPLSGVQAGLAMIPDRVRLVAVLATDHPHLTVGTTARLARAVRADPDRAGAILTDPGGVPQWLVGVWRVPVLRRAIPDDAGGIPVRSVVADLLPVRVPAAGAEASDVDTADDLRRSRGE